MLFRGIAIIGVRGVSVDYSDNQQLEPASIVAWDKTVNSTYVQNLGSKLVFTHQQNTECYTTYDLFPPSLPLICPRLIHKD
jgi:hypothetical protein